MRNKFFSLSRPLTLCPGVLLTSLFLAVSGTSYAQESSDAADDDIIEIVVTGSRIARSSVDTPTPTTILGREAIESSGAINAGEIMNMMPSFGLGTNSQNVSYDFGNAGLTLSNLRNLGEQRTVVLIDGRRAAGTPNGSNILSFDWTTLPASLIDRVEIITGGASAVYGADAVAGVINIITRKSVDSTEISVRYGISDRDDAEQSKVSLSTGFDYADDKGSTVFGFEKNTQNGITYEDRLGYANRGLFFVTNPDNTGPNDGIPDRIPHTLKALYWTSELFSFWNNANADGSPTTDPNEWNIFVFDDGTVRPYDFGTRGIIDGWAYDGDGEGRTYAGADPYVLPIDSTSFSIFNNYQVNDSVNFFSSARYSTSSSTSNIQPYALNDGSRTISVADNPYVTDELRTFMGAETEIYPVVKINNDLGPRSTTIDRQNYTYTFGFNGEFSNRWNWEAFYQYGKVNIDELGNKSVIEDRFTQAMDAVLDADNNIVCRDTSNGCVPINVLGGDGTYSQEAIDFITSNHTSITNTEQRIFGGHLSGDLFELPAGTVSFAAGAEYKKESLDFRPSFMFENGLGGGGSVRAPAKGEVSSEEYFGELHIPLLSDAPGAQSLDLELAVRYADYNLSGDHTSWKSGLNWQPIDDIRIRTTFSVAIRAPALGELFQGEGFGYQSGVDDPCDSTVVDAVTGRRSNCEQLGVVYDQNGDWSSNLTASRAPVRSIGNQGLDVETADTFTFGFVFTPSFLPEFSMSLDYWDYEVEDVIVSFGAQENLDLCANTLSDSYCSQVIRLPGGDVSEVRDTYVNAARMELSGYDLEANYEYELGDYGQLNFRYVATYLDKFDYLSPNLNKANPEDPVFVTSIWGGGIGFPELRSRFTTEYTYEDLTLKLTSTYTGSQLGNTSPDANPEATSMRKMPDVVYFDLYANYDVSENFSVFAGINNMFDRDVPKYPSRSRGDQTYIDPFGRYYFVGANYKF